MPQLIFLDLLLLGAGLLLLLFIRALPRLDETAPAKRGLFERWLTSQFPEKLDAAFSAMWLRMLRRLKVFVLRLDNGITARLQRMKLESGESIRAQGPKIDLKKVAEMREGKDGENADSASPKDPFENTLL